MADRPEGVPSRLPREQVYAALVEALRVASRPRAAWIAGLLVPVFGYVPHLRGDGLMISDGQGVVSPFSGVEFNLGQGNLQIAVTAIALALLWMRLQASAIAGLIVEADRKVGRLERTDGELGEDEPSLKALGKSGESRAQDCFGVLVARYCLGLAAITGFLVLPSAAAVNTSNWAPGLEPIVWSAFVLIVLLVFLYLAVVEVTAQIALMSCVHNGRGPVSALQHAWRLMRSDPGAATRAGLAHFAILVGVALVQGVLVGVLGGLGTILAFAAAGAGGVARISFWERAYDALGGWRTATPTPPRDPSTQKPVTAGVAAVGE
ncbi:hypothetical protein [Engelhardtia mirabilis]|uniref:Uncharacterized protein n=1 Tax=Engelhardtia mirabilis TaxID=2528011 RepID=A0A518BM67_9BACT|nr:hypothetical protein Pla133_31630 [Planctomycetes bacterium Pla133]QDV02396.1 hypothetical protein Pla86_31620 [Planctomycetes bacterium Pla86]